MRHDCRITTKNAFTVLFNWRFYVLYFVSHNVQDTILSFLYGLQYQFSLIQTENQAEKKAKKIQKEARSRSADMQKKVDELKNEISELRDKMSDTENTVDLLLEHLANLRKTLPKNLKSRTSLANKTNTTGDYSQGLLSLHNSTIIPVFVQLYPSPPLTQPPILLLQYYYYYHYYYYYYYYYYYSYYCYYF